MPLIYIVLVIALIGFALWAIYKYVPMHPTFQTILLVVGIGGLAFWLLKVLGLWDMILSVRL